MLHFCNTPLRTSSSHIVISAKKHTEGLSAAFDCSVKLHCAAQSFLAPRTIPTTKHIPCALCSQLLYAEFTPMVSLGYQYFPYCSARLTKSRICVLAGATSFALGSNDRSAHDQRLQIATIGTPSVLVHNIVMVMSSHQ